MKNDFILKMLLKKRIKEYYKEYLDNLDKPSTNYCFETKYTEQELDRCVLKVLVDIYTDDGIDDENRLIYHDWDIIEPTIELILEDNEDSKEEIKNKFKSFQEMKDELGAKFEETLYNSGIELLTEKESLIKHLENKINDYKTQFSQINGDYGLLNPRIEAYEDILERIKSGNNE